MSVATCINERLVIDLITHDTRTGLVVEYRTFKFLVAGANLTRVIYSQSLSKLLTYVCSSQLNLLPSAGTGSE